MISTLAVANYRSLTQVVLPLGPLNVITGSNGSGKSNLYRALRLLAETAQGGVVQALAREGGLPSTLWAGPESIGGRMRAGDLPIEGGAKTKPVRLLLGFADGEFGYAIDLGLPTPSSSMFTLDPEIKRECLWAGDAYRPAAALVDRAGAVIKVRDGREWRVVTQYARGYESIFSTIADPESAPEVLSLRERIRQWRFYDHFRTDADAPARQPQLGTRTPVLHHDGRDLAAALQTIWEVGDRLALAETVSRAFPGGSLRIQVSEDRRFSLEFFQEGLLRPLSGAELSDGTLRFFLLTAALLTPRPPPLLVLNEPESSLHPDLLPALAGLIVKASERTQVWVVSHSYALVEELLAHPGCEAIELAKQFGETTVVGQKMLDEPLWRWPNR